MSLLVNKMRRIWADVSIELRNGTVIPLYIRVTESEDPEENDILDLKIEEVASAETSNPVGVLSANTLTMTLNSLDKSLMPENVNSPYYGLMDATAKVRVTIKDEDGPVDMGVYYVKSWKSSITHSEQFKVLINCTDILSSINKSTVKGLYISRGINSKQYLERILQGVNEGLGEDRKISWNTDRWKMSRFPVLDYTNLSDDKVSNLLNTMCQCTLANYYVDRYGKFIVDDLLDDTVRDSVCIISEDGDVSGAKFNGGNLVNYNKVKVNHFVYNVSNQTTIASLSGQKIVPGLNTFENIGLGDGAYKVNSIRVKGNHSVLKPSVKEFSYTKSTATLVIENTGNEEIEATIEILGQVMQSNTLFTEAQREAGASETLEITNRLLPKERIQQYTNGMLSLLSVRANNVEVTGYFNPRLKLGDIVYLNTVKTLGAVGYYKVNAINWDVSAVLKGTIKLSKTLF